MATAKPQAATASGPAFASSGKDQVSLISKSDGNDVDTRRLLQHIFQPQSQYDPQPSKGEGKPLYFSNLYDFLDEQLENVVKQNHSFIESSTKTDDIGRIGPPNVVFDYKGNLGTLVIEADRLGLSSHSNFSSIRANVSVYKGKWVYELMLASRGVMQLGWCTCNCTFTQEEGVGDTDDSYAYDGNRLRKWNMKSPLKYGELWLTGDVISCAIDCDVGSVTFYRNGKSMGEAFSNLRLGPGMAYFPAVSLSLSENLRANFGATPLRYPIEGHRPLQDPPALDLVKAQHLFEYLERAVPLLCPDKQIPKSHPNTNISVVAMVPKRSQTATVMLAVAHIFDKLAPFMKSAYIVEAGLLKFLLQFCEVRGVCGDHALIQKSLDIIWSFMQESERKPCLDYLMCSLVSAYRFSPATPDFAYQLTFLVLTYAILKHEMTRKYMIKNVLFDKVKFPVFLHVKPPSDEGLLEIIPNACLDLGDRGSDSEDEAHAAAPSDETLRLRELYFESCGELRRRVAELEYLQVEILKLLLINDDNTKGGASTRFVFLHKFREFLRENFPPTSRVTALWVNQCPLYVSLCFFHRLVRAVRYYWDEFYDQNPCQSVPSNEAFVPCERFFDDSVNYFEVQRFGGLMSHLKKTHREEIAKASPVSLKEDLSHHMESQRRQVRDQPLSRDQGSCLSLVELLDGLVLLYEIAAHKQLAKMCSLRDTIHEYMDALRDTDKKITTCPADMTDIVGELQRSKQVFKEKGTEQVRQMAWVVAVVYAREKQEDVYWLLQVILRSISKASDHGKLFSFLPDYYIDSCNHAYQALRSFFHPTRPYNNLPGFSEVLSQVAAFLCEHFADSRIVNADSKDSLVQALACFVCYSDSLRSLEEISEESRLKLTRSLLAPYENRSWAQTNWILVRLWKGCGFGFRYTHLPHLTPSKTQQPDHTGASVRKPCPSLVFQQHISEIMRSEADVATKFIDTVLSQLNWAFSEFIGMLQELQSIASRPTTAFIDSRQLKLCATCFDISVGLMRVLEMIIANVPEVFTDWSKPLAEQLLCRLCQLLTQVLNRITSKSNTFDMVVAASIPGLETVDHFPILGAVTGILVHLILTTSQKRCDCAIQALLTEPGFQLCCLEFLTGGTESPEAALELPSGVKKTFSFHNYKEHVSDEELKTIEKLITFVKTQQQQERKEVAEVDEDSLCEICYARPKSVVFLPCGHHSCKSCITHQMMSKKECFFCKSKITDVVDMEK